jgi:hypothetical protein
MGRVLKSEKVRAGNPGLYQIELAMLPGGTEKAKVHILTTFLEGNILQIDPQSPEALSGMTKGYLEKYTDTLMGELERLPAVPGTPNRDKPSLSQHPKNS